MYFGNEDDLLLDIMDTVYIWLLIHCGLHMVAATKQIHIHDNTLYNSAESLKRPVTDGLTGFGGILHGWMTDLFANHTEARHIVRFAVKYAKARHPTMFPSKKAVRHTMHVRNMSRLKLIYSKDGDNPTMFGAIDPFLQRPVYVPIVWGLLYTFYIHLMIEGWPPSLIIHRFTILEYLDRAMFVIEHSFHCETLAEHSPLRQRADQSNEPIPGLDRSHVDNDQSRPSEQRSGHCEKGMERMESGSSKSLWNQLLQYEALMKTSPDQCHLAAETKLRESVQCSAEVESSQSEHLLQRSETTDHLATKFRCHQESCICRGKGTHQETHDKYHLSILSYNIWNTNSFSGEDNAYIKRIKSLGKLCAESKADVITFQEVRFQDDQGGRLGPNQLDHLAELLPEYQFVYQPAQIQVDRLPGLTVEGVAIFSKYPITYRNALLLSRNLEDPADGHQRVLMHAEIELPGVGSIHVLTTHLSLSHEARLTSVIEISDYVKKLQGPVFLTGDMNAEPHNEEVRFLAGKESLHGRQMAGFYDVWEHVWGNSQRGNRTDQTKDDRRGLTFSTLDDRLTKRIDLIFFKDHPRVAVLDVVLFDDGLRRDKAASDHVGVLARFDVKSQN